MEPATLGHTQLSSPPDSSSQLPSYSARTTSTTSSKAGYAWSRFTLRFADARVEDAYLNSRLSRLQNGLAIGDCSFLLFFAVAAYGALSDVAEGTGEVSGEVSVETTAVLLVVAVGILALLTAAAVPRLRRLLPYRAYEGMAAAFCIGMLLFVLWRDEADMNYTVSDAIPDDARRSGRNRVGRSPQIVANGYVDENLGLRVQTLMMLAAVSQDAMTLAGAVVVSHFLLSMRWFVLLIIDLIYLACFTFTCIDMGIGHARGLVPIFFAVVVFSSAGHYMLEATQRQLFTAFLDEKTLRVQAEFRASLDLPAPGSRGPRSEVSCGASTTDTAAMFAAMSSSTPPLATLVEMGKREQWLINEHELTMDHKAVLGRGGFGVTLAGTMGRSEVAIKLYPKTICGELDGTVLNELRILRHVRHPNIVLFHGTLINAARGEVSLVMERVEGIRYGAFVEGIQAASSSTSGAVQSRVLRLVTSALVHLHTRSPSIVHADLKPDNVLVEQRASGPFPKLLDFGIAVVATKRGKVAGGTPGWAAPELYNASGKLKTIKATPAVDVYALGLLACFTTIGEVTLAQQKDPRELDMVLASGHKKSRLFEHWRPTVRSCLSVKPEERFPILDVYDRLFSDCHSFENASADSLSRSL